jgi:hypothetical protein
MIILVSHDVMQIERLSQARLMLGGHTPSREPESAAA